MFYIDVYRVFFESSFISSKARQVYFHYISDLHGIHCLSSLENMMSVLIDDSLVLETEGLMDRAGIGLIFLKV